MNFGKYFQTITKLKTIDSLSYWNKAKKKDKGKEQFRRATAETGGKWCLDRDASSRHLQQWAIVVQ